MLKVKQILNENRSILVVSCIAKFDGMFVFKEFGEDGMGMREAMEMEGGEETVPAMSVMAGMMETMDSLGQWHKPCIMS